MQTKIIVSTLILVLIMAGCQVFPYVTPPSPEVTDESPLPTASPVATEISSNQSTSEAEISVTSSETIEPILTESDGDPALIYLPIAMQATSRTYTLQEDNPIYLPNFAQPSAGCAWMGVAGQAFSKDNQPIRGILIIAGKVGEEQQLSAATGQAIAYGPGGYEIQLSTEPVTTQAVYWVQLVDLTGQALSEIIFFDTYQDCQKNLALINFVELIATAIDGDAIRLPKTQPLPEESAYP